MDTEFWLVFAVALAIVILIRILASTNNILGKICRWFWNTSFKIAAHIPLCGWMAHFIIGEEKTIYIPKGKAADAWGADMLSNAADRGRAQREREEAIRGELASRGYVDVSVKGDGTFATAKDKKGNRYNIHITEK